MDRERESVMEAIEAHGGMENWNPVKEIKFKVRTTGAALASRLRPFGFGTTFVSLSVRFPRVTIASFPRKGLRGLFERERVAIERENGTVVKERLDPGKQMGSLRRKLYWDDLDLLFFGGFAFWNYFNLPFILEGSGFVLEEMASEEIEGKILTRLNVIFPEDIPTHSREQVFYFNTEGLLVRHDYTALVFGKWARAAHYSSDFTLSGGLVFPTRRVVYPRTEGGQVIKSVVLVHLEISDIEVVRL